jgi:hypothetical protein
MLSGVATDQVALGLLATIEANGRAIAQDALLAAAKATRGYPYLIQLIGSLIWGIHEHQEEISLADVEIGVPLAVERLYGRVIKPMLSDLSSKDVDFLRAMSMDEKQSRIADVASRMQVSPSYASQYRRRLLDARLIQAPATGVIEYTMPFMREYFLDDQE